MKSKIRMTLASILLGYPVLIGAGGDVFYPLLVVQLPLDCLANPGLKGFGRFPTQFTIDLGGIDRIAPVVTRAVGYIGDLFLVALSIGER